MIALDHVTAIVEDAETTARALEAVLGIAAGPEVVLPGMSIRTLRIGEVELHVNAPAGPGPVRDHLARHGPGLHHLAVRVADLDAAMGALAALSISTLGAPVETAKGLREVFLDPARTGGVMIQLVERRAEVRATDLDAASTAALIEQAGARITR
ncbi:VOC family protein [Pendulispora albinea]|uniref:VOC family protein n=1 Tax=Pendulispora albinea TaxID=2741071 RepID=A0ABZ2LQ00_9BACT